MVRYETMQWFMARLFRHDLRWVERREGAGVLEDFFEGTHLSRPMIIMSVGRLDDVHRGRRLRRPRGIIRRALARSLGPEPGH